MLTTEPIRITTFCGPGSTEINGPSLPNLEQPIDFAQYPMLVSAIFDSSNELCPIAMCELTEGSDDFTFQWNGARFTILLKDEYLPVLGMYEYTVKAVAVGGADSTLTGQMTVIAANPDFEYVENIGYIGELPEAERLWLEAEAERVRLEEEAAAAANLAAALVAESGQRRL